jgi:hypothetical protein
MKAILRSKRLNRQDAENAKEENTPRKQIPDYKKTNSSFLLAYFPTWRAWRLGGSIASLS